MSKSIFITGTGTDIGKTYVSALIVKKLRQKGNKSAYYKAAMSGNIRCYDGSLIAGDASYVKYISGTEQPIDSMQRKQDEAFRAVSLRRLLTGGSDPQDTSEL